MKQQIIDKLLKKEQLQIIEEYQKYFGNVLKKVNNQNILTLPKSTLEDHRINVVQQARKIEKDVINHGNVYIQLTHVKNNGLECTYEAIVGQFFLIIKMLNLQRNAESQINQENKIGRGSFGIVKKVFVQNKQIAIKKINFSSDRKREIILPHLLDPQDYAQPFEIRQAIKEYCIYKICSMLKIGPQLIFNNVYDLVCYNDCIQFQMELCQTVGSCKQAGFQEDLKYCTAMMHSLKFVHKDIKPPNVLYSPSLNKYVLTDFGISNSIGQKLSQKTETYFQGSLNYASDQMKEIYGKQQPAFINLYLNDFHALKITIQQISNDQKAINQNFSRNSMSIMGYESSGNQDYQSYVDSSINSQNMDNSVANSGTGEIISEQSYNQSTVQSFNEDIFKFSNQINFYVTKSLFNLHKRDDKINKKIIKEVVIQACGQHDENKINQKVQSMLCDILVKSQSNSEVVKIRNIARIFGIFSQEMRERFQELQKNRKIPELNYGRLRFIINSIKKCTKTLAHKKIEVTVSDMNRHLHLRNFRSLIVSLRHILKHCKQQVNTTDRQKDKKVLLYCLMMFQSGFTNVHVINDIIECIQIYLGINIIKSGKKYEDLFVAVHNLYLNFEQKQLLNIESLLMFFRTFFRIDPEGQAQLLEKIHNKLKYLIQLKRKQLKQDDILSKMNFINYEIQVLLKLRKFQSALQIINRWKVEVDGFDICANKIIFLDSSVTILSNLNLYQIAEKHNQDSFLLKKKYLFPREIGPEYGQYYFNKAVIVGQHKKNLQQAIIYYEKALNNLQDSLKYSSFTPLLIQTYNNLSLCLDLVGRVQEACLCLERCYNNMIVFSSCKLESTVYILDNLIRMMLRINKSDNILCVYFNQLVSLKWQIAKNRCEFSDRLIKKLPVFLFQNLNEQQCKYETIIYAKRLLIISIQPFLPAFLHYFCNICDDLVSYYINICSKPSKALPYLWKFFHYQSKLRNDQQFYQKLSLHIEMLIKSNSSRRALKFLKLYAFFIEDHHQQFQNEVFRKIAKITRQLETKDRLFYNTVWKEKGYKNIDNYNKCFQIFENMSLPMKLCHTKMLKKLKKVQKFPQLNSSIQ